MNHMNGIDILLTAVIAAVVILAVRKMYKDRKNGKLCSCGESGCDGNCGSCGAGCARRGEDA